MNRGFYPRLAWTGMKQNRRLYLPYLLTCTGITAMFYILMGLSVSSVLPQMSGGRSTALIMSLGSVVIRRVCPDFPLLYPFVPHPPPQPGVRPVRMCWAWARATSPVSCCGRRC